MVVLFNNCDIGSMCSLMQELTNMEYAPSPTYIDSVVDDGALHQGVVYPSFMEFLQQHYEDRFHNIVEV